MGYVFSKESWPIWAYTDIWAPEIHQIDGTFYVYFSARKRRGEYKEKLFTSL
jgi:GH43 family beta-xylosidase